MTAYPPISSARALEAGPERQHLAHVRIGRVLLGVQVVAVVPDDDEPEVGDRCEHRRPGPEHDADLSAADAQEAAIALSRPELRAQLDVRARTQHAVQRRGEPRHVTGVRHHDQSATTGPHAGGDRGRDGVGDVVAGSGKGAPDGAGRATAG